ncbi:putative WD40 repeat [Frankia sp. Hr75.2]|nr:putative WD40 repeat [Frankia sp. Hr75.2]
MAHVFISYAFEDRQTAEEVLRWLRVSGNTAFLAHDLEVGLRVGEAWRERLYAEIRRADALVCLVTPAFVSSPWCAAELGIAGAYGVRILPVRAAKNASHRLISSGTQWADLDADPVKARSHLVEALRGLTPGGAARWSPGRSPYPGLRAFDAGYERVFFGRGAETRELAERLRAAAETGRGILLAVIGPSGCGKSSLMHAGLVPTLASDSAWRVLPSLAAGADPRTSLARVLAAEGQEHGLPWTFDTVAESLDAGTGLDGLVDELLAATVPARRLLVLVDQAEEVLLQRPGVELERFAAVLGSAMSSGQLHVVITLRSEYLDQLSSLASSVGVPVATSLLGPLSTEQLPLVVTEPARVAGMSISDGLVARIVEDTGSGDALPLLAFVLERLADGVGQGQTLSADRYELLGGVRGALSRQADRALSAARAASGRSAEQVLTNLLRMASVDVGGRFTRRSVDLADFSSTARVELDQFVHERLVTVSADDGPPRAKITHAKILTDWPPLATALTEAAARVKMQASVEDAATEWVENDESASFLWNLDRASTAARSVRTADLSAAGRQFLEAGVRRGKWRRRRTQASLVALASLIILGSTGLVLWRSAADRESAIRKARLAAIADGLLARADTTKTTDPRAALRLEVAADKISPSQRTRSELLSGLAGVPLLHSSLVGHAGRLRSLALSDDLHTLATSSDGGSAFLWDISDPDDPRQVAGPLDNHTGGVSEVAFGNDSGTLVAGGQDGTITMWGISDPLHPRVLGQPLFIGDENDPFRSLTSMVISIAVSDDGTRLAADSLDGTVAFLDIGDPAHIREVGKISPEESGGPSSIAFRQSHLVMVGAKGQISLWDVHDLVHPRRVADALPGQEGGSSTIAMSSDGSVLATGGADGAAVLWDIGDLAHPRRLGDSFVGQVGAPNVLAFSSDGSVLAMGGADGAAVLWDIGDLAHPRRLGDSFVGQVGALNVLAFSPDGTRLVSGGDDGSAILWDVHDPRRRAGPIASSTKKIYSVAYNAGDTVLASGGGDGMVVLLDVTDRAHPRRLSSFSMGQPGAVTTVAFDGSRPILATGGIDGSIAFWDVSDPAHPRRMSDVVMANNPQAVLEAALPAAVLSMTFNDSGTLLAAGGDDGVVHLWDMREPRHPRLLVGSHVQESDFVNALVFSSDGKLLITGSADGSTTLWSLEDPERAARVGGADLDPKVWVSSLALDDTRHILAVGTIDGDVVLWDIGDPRRPRQIGDLIIGGDGQASAIAFDPATDVLAVGSSGGTVAFWDVTDPVAPNRLGGPLELGGSGVETLQFDRSGDTLATGGENGDVSLWNTGDVRLSNTDAVALACRKAGRGLTETEWRHFISDLSYQRTC